VILALLVPGLLAVLATIKTRGEAGYILVVFGLAALVKVVSLFLPHR